MKNQVNKEQNPSSIEHGGERQSVESTPERPKGFYWSFDPLEQPGPVYVCHEGIQIAVTTSLDTAQRLSNMLNGYEALKEALETLLEVCPCQNNCAAGDMSCASNKARAALELVTPK